MIKRTDRITIVDDVNPIDLLCFKEFFSEKKNVKSDKYRLMLV